MDIEQLREVVGLIQSLGDDAKGAFLWYLACAYGPNALFSAAWTAIGGTVVIRISTAAVKAIRIGIIDERLKAAAGYRGPWLEREVARACEILREGR